MTTIVVPGRVIHVCVVYSNTGYAAERSVIVSQLVPLITVDIADKLQISYVEYTNTVTLESYYQFGIRLFLSALNSNDCLLLQNTFFNSHPGSVHLNSYSTSTEFNTTYNLLRVLTPDSYTGRLYAKIMQNTTPIIIYDASSSWSYGLYQDIISAVVGTTVGIEVTTDYIESLENLTIPGNATIVVLTDTLAVEVINNILNASLSYDFNFLFGDALNEYKFPTIASELQAHNTLLIQSYVTSQQLEYTNVINFLLNHPEHPASELLTYFRQLFDVAILHSNTKLDYVNLHLSTGFDSTNGQYSIMPYDNNGNLTEYGYGLVDETNVIIGSIV